MKLKLNDLFATLLVVAIAIPYIGFLARGEMSPIEDPRGMAGTGLAFGAAAFYVMWRGDPFDRTGKAEAAMTVLSLALGVAAYELSRTAAADVLLAVFMVSMVLVWVVKLADHMGGVHWHDVAGTAR